MSFLTQPMQAFANWLSHPSKRRIMHLSEGSSKDTDMLSIKGAYLCEMSKNPLLRVPPAFIVTTAASMEWRNRAQLNEDLVQELTRGVTEVERQCGRIFGSSSPIIPPLLLCVRGGALVPMPQSNPFSMQAYTDASESQFIPGMHKTMIVGMNDSVVDQLTMLYSRRIALRMYCQFLLSFGTNIYGLSMEQYNAVLIRLRKTTGHSNVWTVEDYEVMVKEFKALQSVSDDVWVQLHLVIAQVYTSWYGEKAILFRKALDFSEELGTAVIIQEMIVGDSGVLSTRDPSGHDQEITGYVIKSSTDRKISLQEHYMNDFKYRDQFTKIKSEVEWMFKDMMGVSFTIDLEEEVHLVQCKPGYRDAKGAVKIAYHMADEHVITERQALMQVDPLKLEYYLRDHLEPEDMKEFRDHIVIVRGDVVARSGCVSGQVCFGSEELLRLEPNTMILVKDDCTLADADAIKASVGVITVDGDISSDTATLCRGLGKPCLVHATPLTFEVDSRGIITGMMCDKYRIHTGDLIFLDSNNGDVKLAFHHPVFASNDLDLRALLKWSDDVRRIRVYAFAESCSEATFGLNCGAEGMGKLALTFNVNMMLEYLIGQTDKERAQAIACIEHTLFAQYARVIRTHHKKRINVRVFDSGLKEFLPANDDDAVQLGSSLNLPIGDLKAAMRHYQGLHAIDTNSSVFNTLLHPELVHCQLSALFDAVLIAYTEGVHILVDLTFSGVENKKELDLMKGMVVKAKQASVLKAGLNFDDMALEVLATIGILVATPQQCLTCHEFSNELDHITFDVERLTMLTMGMSQFNAQRALQLCFEKEIIKENPFVAIDAGCVGRLMKECIMKCRRMRAGGSVTLKIGVDCGAHYVCARSIYYLHQLKIDYISCDPFKVPVARLILAQAHIDEGAVKKLFELSPSMTPSDDVGKDDMNIVDPDDWLVIF